MKIEEFFNQQNIIDLSFFNFSNAQTGCYFATNDLIILRVNNNFKNFFPVLGNVSNAYFPDVLIQLGIKGEIIDNFIKTINSEAGMVLIPEIRIVVNDVEKVFSLLSRKTTSESFSYLNGIQGQFVDRTKEWDLRKERENLVAQREKDRAIIVAKSDKLEHLAKRLSKYLSPQVYASLFAQDEDKGLGYKRKNLTLFFSDIVNFTDMSDRIEPESLAKIVNSYLSEMANIALEIGGTIDKFIGDAVVVFFWRSRE